MIRISIEDSTHLNNAKDVIANDVCVGHLSSIAAAPEELRWDPYYEAENVKFQFRNESTFMEVVEAIKRYKDEQGHKYLSIWEYANGYVAQLNKELLEKAGFRHLPDKHPAAMYLE